MSKLFDTPNIKRGQDRETPSLEFAAMVVVVCIGTVGIAAIIGIVYLVVR